MHSLQYSGSLERVVDDDDRRSADHSAVSPYRLVRRPSLLAKGIAFALESLSLAFAYGMLSKDLNKVV